MVIPFLANQDLTPINATYTYYRATRKQNAENYLKAKLSTAHHGGILHIIHVLLASQQAARKCHLLLWSL